MVSEKWYKWYIFAEGLPDQVFLRIAAVGCEGRDETMSCRFT